MTRVVRMDWLRVIMFITYVVYIILGNYQSCFNFVLDALATYILFRSIHANTP